MRRLGSIILIFIFVIFGLFVISCKKETDETPNNEKKEITINLLDSNLELNVGSTHKINLEIINAEATVEYEIADTSVISIKNNTITALKAGSTTIKVVVTCDDALATTKEFTLDVTVKVDSFTISYQSNVDGFSKEDEKVSLGDVKKFTDTPHLDGYEFVGWFFLKEMGYESVSEVKITSDITVYAIFNPKEYNIIYILNGSLYNGPDTIKHGEVLTLGIPTREGYDFLGWTLDEDPDTYVTEVTVASNIILYANFTLKEYTINYELDGGTYSGTTKAHYGENIYLRSATKENCVFLGWTMEKGSTDYISRLEVTSDITVYANFDLKEFTVKFNLDGGTYDGPSKVKYGEALSLGLAVKEGFTFLGWTIEKGSNNYITEVIGRDKLVVYADFEEIKEYPAGISPIRYYLNGGDWNVIYVMPNELGLEFMADFKESSSRDLPPEKLDCSYIESSWFGDMMQNKKYLNKWMWLLDAIWEANDGADSLKPATADFTSLDVKGFYLANLNGFFTSTQHKDTYIGPLSLNFEDPDISKAVYSKGTPISSDLGPSEYTEGVGIDSLPTPLKTGFEFVKWTDLDGNTVNAISKAQKGKVTLIAVWKEEAKPMDVEISNLPTDGIKLYDSYTLNWIVTPNEAVNKKVIFTSLTSTILDITEDGIIKAKSVGIGKIKIKLKGNPDFEKIIEIPVWSGEYFDVAYETESYVEVGKSIHLLASYVTNKKERLEVTWSALTENIATVDANGNVEGKHEGLATIRATAKDGVYFDFYVTVLGEGLSDEIKFIISNHISNASATYNLGIGAGSPEYYYDVISGVNNLIFDPLKIDYRYYDKLPEGTKNYGLMSSVEFITVHYTGNMKDGADADNNCSYFNNLEYRASIHYVTGRTNLTDLTNQASGYNADAYYAFAGLNEKYAGWHATNADPAIWDYTGLEVLDGDPLTPVISISSNLKYTINGRETNISIPEPPSGYKVNGDVLTVSGLKYSVFNKYGLITKVVDGKYYLARTHWGTQREPRCLCTCGGNKNSIGIESCVDKGSDLEHTWHVTAQLVAGLLVKYNLGFDRVVGHHFFSGKDCPQPFLEKDMKLWYEFMDMVKAEYELLTTYKNMDVTAFAINDDGILKDNGLLVQDADSHCVTYEVTIKVGDRTETITLATIVESYFKCTEKRTTTSLQIQGVPII